LGTLLQIKKGLLSEKSREGAERQQNVPRNIKGERNHELSPQRGANKGQIENQCRRGGRRVSFIRDQESRETLLRASNKAMNTETESEGWRRSSLYDKCRRGKGRGKHPEG